MSAFFCSTWALSLEVCALARVMKTVRSAHQAIRACLMSSPPLSQSRPTIGHGSRSVTSPWRRRHGSRPVSNGDVHGPPAIDIGSGQGPGVLTLETVSAMSDQIDLEEPWGLLHLVHRPTDHDRGT